MTLTWRKILKFYYKFSILAKTKHLKKNLTIVKKNNSNYTEIH